MSEELAKAAFDGDVETVRRLLDEGAEIDAQGRNWNPLHTAIENGQVACVRLLIARGADVECPVGGLSPLANAVDAAIDGTIQNARNFNSTKLIELLTIARKRRPT